MSCILSDGEDLSLAFDFDDQIMTKIPLWKLIIIFVGRRKRKEEKKMIKFVKQCI